MAENWNRNKLYSVEILPGNRNKLNFMVMGHSLIRTKHFTILKPQIPSTDEVYEAQKSLTTDFEVLNLQKGSVGMLNQNCVP